MARRARRTTALNILVVEPDPLRRQGILGCLQEDALLRVLASGATLLETLKNLSSEKGEPDVLIPDADQPEMDHPRTWAILHLLLPLRIRIVALTSGDDAARLEWLFSKRVAGLLPPEAGPEEICRAVRRAGLWQVTVHSRLEEPLRLRLALPPEEMGEWWQQDARWDEATGEVLFRGRRVRLTPRQRQVLLLVGKGLSNAEIALELGIKPSTVAFHITNLLRALGVQSRVGLALVGRALRPSRPAP